MKTTTYTIHYKTSIDNVVNVSVPFLTFDVVLINARFLAWRALWWRVVRSDGVVIAHWQRAVTGALVEADRRNAEYLNEIDQQTATQLREQLEALKLLAQSSADDDAAAQS